MADGLRDVDHNQVSASAVEQVRARLEGFPGARSLTSDELTVYSARKVVQGWLLPISFEGGVEHTVRILVDLNFPFSRPLVAVSRGHFLEWPHIQEDGIVCPLPDSATTNPYQPVHVVDRILGEVAALIDDALKGLLTEDFQEEFLSYWNRRVSSSAPKIVSLLAADPPTRIVKLWRGENHYLAADSEKQAEDWLRRRYPGDRRVISSESALLVHIPQALLPGDYPTHGSDILRLIREKSPNAIALFQQLLSEDTEHLVIVFTAPTQRGLALAAVKVAPPNSSNILGRKTATVNRGFRPGHVPFELLLSRFFASDAPLERIQVSRADPRWIHGRDRNPDAAKLAACKVAIFGIGSVGGFVAEHLASAGVGLIQLIDPETLTFANAGRHILGVNSESKNKAQAVAELLQSRFPHHSIEGFIDNAQDFLRTHELELGSFDLLISTTGDWATDSFLNEWQRSREAEAPQQLLYGWLEPHAVAGHAVLITPRSSCLRCNFDDTGKSNFQISEWKHSTQYQEPACGGLFQPYGPIELAFINSTISSLAIASLLGEFSESTHRTFVTDVRSIEKLGGAVTVASAQFRAGTNNDQQTVATSAWPRNPTCPRCGRSND